MNKPNAFIFSMSLTLDATDKQLIYHLELDARVGIEALSRKIGVNEAEVAGRIKQLKERNILIGDVCFINITKLDFTGHALFLKIRKEEKEKLIEFAKTIPSIYWICNTTGLFDVIVAIQARDYVELDESVKRLLNQSGHSIEHYALSTRLQVDHFHRKYLIPQLKGEPSKIFWGKHVPTDIPLTTDERKTIHFISHKADYSFVELAGYLQKNEDAVRKIILRLGNADIIQGYHSMVNPRLFGFKVFQLLVRVSSVSKKQTVEFFDYCARHPNITVLVHSVGSWQHEITYEIPLRAVIGQYSKELLKKFSFISNIETLPTNDYYVHYRFGYPSSKQTASGSIVLKKLDDLDFVALREVIRSIRTKTTAFEFCPGYLTQATRNFPRVAHWDNNIAFVTKKTSASSSNFVIVVAAGLNMVLFTNKLAQYLFSKSRKPVILKNIDSSMEKELLCLEGFRNYYPNESWNSYARYDDQTFPQILIQNKLFLNMQGSEYAKLREKLNWFDRRYNIEVIPYGANDFHIFETLLHQWSKDMHTMHGVTEKELIASHLMYGELKDYYYQYLVYEKATRKYVGYLCFSTISEDVCGFNALINDFGYPELYRKMMYKGIEIAHRLGFTYTNLQGSETQEQFGVKQWFVPQKLILKKHLIYDPKIH